jgi:hypothetical protein
MLSVPVSARPFTTDEYKDSTYTAVFQMMQTRCC